MNRHSLSLVCALAIALDGFGSVDNTTVDGLEDGGQGCLRFPLAHLRVAPQHLGSPASVFPPDGNPHAMLPVFANLQAAFLETLSTHFLASFLRLRR